jgi:hypothetical protein
VFFNLEKNKIIDANVPKPLLAIKNDLYANELARLHRGLRLSEGVGRSDCIKMKSLWLAVVAFYCLLIFPGQPEC